MRADTAIGVLLLSLSSAMFALTFDFPDPSIALPPTYFPRFVTVCMAALSILLIVQSLRRPKPVEEAPRLSPAAWIRQGSVQRIVVMAAVGFVYTQVVDDLGFLIATGLFLAVTVVVFMERRWLAVLSVSVLGTSVLYGVFRMLFKVPLPRFDLF